MNDTQNATPQTVEERPLSLSRRPDTTYLPAEGLDAHLWRAASGQIVVLPVIAIAQRTDVEGFTDLVPVVWLDEMSHELPEVRDLGLEPLGVTAHGVALPTEEAPRGV